MPAALHEAVERIEASLVGWRLDRLRRALDGPLAVVATGASASAARFWAMLHRRAGQPAWTQTPDDLSAGNVPPKSRVLLLSREGRHHDVLRAARHALEAGVPTHAVVADPASPLVSLLRGHDDSHQVFVLPRTDDRLPTHALVPFLVLAAQHHASGPFAPLFAEVPAAPLPETRPKLLVALGGGIAAPAAADFAWRAVEGGLCPALATDARDIAHGAYMPMVGLGPEALVVSFAHHGERAYLDRYFRAFDPTVPVVRIETAHDDTLGALDLMARGMATFERHAARAEVAGRTEPPAWGKAIYYLARPSG